MVFLNVISLWGELHLSIIVFDAVLVICLGILCALLYFSYGREKIMRQYTNLKQVFKSRSETTSSIEINDRDLDKKAVNQEKYILYSSIYRELTFLMEKEKVYHDPRLTRDEVVVRLGTSKKIFLEALQNHVNMNFIDYVNTYRLNEAINLLENEDFTNETIAETVGFGSANTFYRQFKLKYGLSPYEYKKNLTMFLVNSDACEVEM